MCETIYLWREEEHNFLEDPQSSQALPACPSDKGKMGMKTLPW